MSVFLNCGTAEPKDARSISHGHWERQRILAHIVQHTIIPEETGQERKDPAHGHEIRAELEPAIGRDETGGCVEAEA